MAKNAHTEIDIQFNLSKVFPLISSKIAWWWKPCSKEVKIRDVKAKTTLGPWWSEGNLPHLNRYIWGLRLYNTTSRTMASIAPATSVVLQANQEHFNADVAARYDEHPLHAEMAKRIGKALLKTYPFDDETTSVLDYACGTGLNSKEILPHVRSILGVDISQSMVDKYNEQANNQGMEPNEMRAICADLRGEPGELDDSKFDVVICCMSYHHFADPLLTSRKLAYFLKPGGYLFVADVESTQDCAEILPSSASHVVAHKHGFSQEVVKSFFQEADLVSFDFRRVTKARKNGREVNIFLARGIKPGTE
ncbi:hexaprenyldihydroxybenzoate methyltransferase [Moniliophthora roreri MCA 2997]|uniref:Hexaprenyldihydroxybenzoate methyltransferase n=1 Tax=Moniliophthora roreri (strain MCA 2997) TaxID=1381753 RepID=V2XES5_MONRO|nr:hexaprenyldihydroxybenzoate methyltransferase [Moniliophthora roreri MCA 2997]KAI3615821.1 hexaprenyldihydroxybenzoate methyltransferase [Moniliophthora roreri]